MKHYLKITLYSLFVVSLVPPAKAENGTRPFYNIAHMVNHRSQIDEWLAPNGYGANAIETDVCFDSDGTPRYLYHGIPCDFGRICTRWDRTEEYMEAVSERTVPTSQKFNPNFALLMFDLKMRKLKAEVLWSAGEKFANLALLPLYRDRSSKLKVIVSVPDFTKKDFIKGLLAQLKAQRPDIVDRIGFDINSEKELTDPGDMADALKKLGVLPGHVWLSEGTSNWFMPVKKWKIRNRLRSLIGYKDTSNGYVSKAYTWTADFHETVRFFLRTGIDGIITNYPQNVLKAIKDINQEMKEKGLGGKLRLATLEDDPFVLVTRIDKAQGP